MLPCLDEKTDMNSDTLDVETQKDTTTANGEKEIQDNNLLQSPSSDKRYSGQSDQYIDKI